MAYTFVTQDDADDSSMVDIIAVNGTGEDVNYELTFPAEIGGKPVRKIMLDSYTSPSIPPDAQIVVISENNNIEFASIPISSDSTGIKSFTSHVQNTSFYNGEDSSGLPNLETVYLQMGENDSSSVELNNCPKLKSIVGRVIRAKNCPALETVQTNITDLQQYMFDGDSSLKNIIDINNKPITFDEFPQYCFRNCSSLKKIPVVSNEEYIASGTNSISFGQYCFAGCTGLESIDMREIKGQYGRINLYMYNNCFDGIPGINVYLPKVAGYTISATYYKNDIFGAEWFGVIRVDEDNLESFVALPAFSNYSVAPYTGDPQIIYNPYIFNGIDYIPLAGSTTPIFTMSENGLVPAPLIVSGKFLSDNGLWKTISVPLITVTDNDDGTVNINITTGGYNA